MPNKRALYRLYDAADQLLYVGIGIAPEYRVRAHRRKPWGHLIVRAEIEWYPTDRAAAVAEKQAIRGEHPIHNRMRYPGGTFELNRDGSLGQEI
jgi:hypothetical protein